MAAKSVLMATSASMKNTFNMTSERLRAFVLPVFLALLGFVAFTQQRLVDQDLWGHLAFGRAIFSSGQMSVRDTYAYVPTHPWINHEWLTEVLFYLVLLCFGSVGLLVLKGLAGSIAALAVGWGVPRPARSTLLVIVVAAVAMHGLQEHVFVRPYVVSYLFFAVTVCVLERHRAGQRALAWLLVPLVVLWANCHAAFVVGVGLIVIYLLGGVVDGAAARVRQLFVVLGACSIGSLLNPYGTKYVGFVLKAVLMSRPYITEWRPLPWHGLWFWEVKLLLAAALTVLVVRRVSRANAVWWTVLAVTASMTIQHYRHAPFFLLASVAYLPLLCSPADVVPRATKPTLPNGGDGAERWHAKVRGIDTHGKRQEIARVAGVRWQVFGGFAACDFFRVLNSKIDVGAGVIACAGLLGMLMWRPVGPLQIPLHQGLGLSFPLRAVEFMRLNRLSGNVLCYFDWGELLIWELSPDVKVSFDGRLETVYDDDVIDDNLNFTYGEPAARRLLRNYPTSIVMALTSSRATLWMDRQTDWRRIYQEPLCTIYVKAEVAAARREWTMPPPCEAIVEPFDRWLATRRCDP